MAEGERWGRDEQRWLFTICKISPEDALKQTPLPASGALVQEHLRQCLDNDWSVCTEPRLQWCSLHVLLNGSYHRALPADVGWLSASLGDQRISLNWGDKMGYPDNTSLSFSNGGVGGELSSLNNCSEQFITMCLGNRLYLHLPGIKQLSLHKSWLAFPCALDWSTIIALPLSSPKAKALYWVFISYLMTWACCICLNVAFLWLPHWAHWLGWLLRVPG